MVYFKGLKGRKLVALGYDPKNILPTCRILTYKQINKREYNALIKQYFYAV